MSETIIFHIDVNNAFLSWEATYRLEELQETVDLRTIPAVIGGDEAKRHGIVLAKSDPAKKCGIVTAEPLVSARRKCPNLLVVPANFEVYTQKSHALMKFLYSYAPKVAQFSIDEAFCDFTGTKALYGDPVKFAHKLKDEIKETLGFTVNIGISSNYLLAKMASDFEKPDRVHTLFPDEIQAKMWPLPVSDLIYVGKSSVRPLHNLGIFTIGDLANTDVDVLRMHLKKHGADMWRSANGYDDHDWDYTDAESKGFSNAMTLPTDVVDKDTAYAILLSIAETVGIRVRRDNAYVSTIGIKMIDSEFNHFTRQTTLASPTNITDKIYETACMLLDQHWDMRPLRLIGIQTAKATHEHYEQYDLFDTEKNEKLGKLNAALDQIRDRYGRDAVKRACFVDVTKDDTTET